MIEEYFAGTGPKAALSIHAGPWEMLRRRRNFDPLVAPVFPNRTDWLHRMCVVKQAYRDTGDIRIFRASHENGCAANLAEELIEGSTKVGGARKQL